MAKGNQWFFQNSKQNRQDLTANAMQKIRAGSHPFNYTEMVPPYSVKCQ